MKAIEESTAFGVTSGLDAQGHMILTPNLPGSPQPKPNSTPAHDSDLGLVLHRARAARTGLVLG